MKKQKETSSRLNLDLKFSLALEGENPLEHNFYKPGVGYITKHIPKSLQRGNTVHWDEQYKESESFDNSWKSRSGPLEFVYNLSLLSDKELIVINLGAGLGSFSVDLARIPNTTVHHVDFSKEGNIVARQKSIDSKVDCKIKIHTMDNDKYLKEFIASGMKADIIFLYGASGSNEPSDKKYAKTLDLSSKTLKDGGYLWHVTMIQPRLIDPLDTRIKDTLGDFPKPPGMAKEILINLGLNLVREEEQERPDFHPLVPKGEPIHHLHLAYRCLFVNSKNNKFKGINFDFQNAVSSEWNSIWNRLICLD